MGATTSLGLPSGRPQLGDHPIHELSDSLFDELLAHDPENATYLGIPGYDHLWADRSPDGHTVFLDTMQSYRGAVEQLPPAINRWDRLAVDVTLAELHHEIERHETGDVRRDLNSIASPLQDYREVFEQAPKSTEEDWSHVVRRLESMGDAMAGYFDGLLLGLSRGETVAARQVAEAIRQARVVESDTSPFLGLLAEYGEGPLAGRLADAVAAGRAAFGAFADHLAQDYLPHAPSRDAVGAERYRAATRYFLGTDVDAADAYEWGWAEIAALSSRMGKVADRIAPGATLAGAVEVLKTDPQRAAADHPAFVAFAQARINEALERLAGVHFDVPDTIARCDVRMASPGGALGAYYVSPSEDFTRPGTVYWSMGEDDGPIPLYDQVTTAYHEGFPGHHLQSGIQLTVADKLCRLHRVGVWKSGSGEGWALYAERLMDEEGFLDEPDYEFGYLAAHMHRACRVVIDIGSHLELPIPSHQPFRPGEPWSFEAGVELLERYATLGTADARSEMTRYLGWPGQAIAYSLGEREILELRDKTRRTRGTEYSAKEFHRRLLEIGSIDIDLMKSFLLEDD